MTWEHVPGYVSELQRHGETTVVVEADELVRAATYLRDVEDWSMLVDIAATDYLGWGERPVAGYIGTAAGRDINHPGSSGLATLPGARPRRFSMSYHLLKLAKGAPRLRLQVWLDDGQPVPSVLEVWPGADWFEREAWDMMGIPVEGHPYLRRLLMDEDWEGHPLRKDYPLGGEPVRFSGDE